MTPAVLALTLPTAWTVTAWTVLGGVAATVPGESSSVRAAARAQGPILRDMVCACAAGSGDGRL